MFDSQSYQQALNLLHKASTPFGFVAAVQEYDNYKRVWTRDGVITSIAALLSGDKKLIEAAKITIETLLNNQHKNGYMPSNVAEDGSVSYGGTCGRADNPSWAVVGLGVYTLLTDDKSLWDKYQPEVSNCFAVLEAWEFNGKHLIYVPQSGDWADEYIQHGYVLFDQLLRLWALKLASKLTQNKSWEDKAALITSAIQSNYWKVDGQPNAYAPNLVHQLNDESSDFWLMGFNPARIYKYFDLQANTFAILLGVGNAFQNDNVTNYMVKLHDKRQSLLPSFYPTIETSDADMNDLKNNYAYNFRNEPNYFHNGGLWPVWNGWAVGALKMQGKTELAQSLLKAIHKSNAQEDLFNECLHGKTDKPCGVPNCTWSAAGAVIAEQALVNNDFNELFKF